MKRGVSSQHRLKSKGQISVEYLIIVGFALFIITILIATYTIYSQHNESVIISKQVQRISMKLVDNAEEVYYYGPPTKNTLKLYFPKNIEDIQIYNNELLFKVHTAGGISDIEAVSEVNLTGNLPSSRGIKYIEIIAKDNGVLLKEK